MKTVEKIIFGAGIYGLYFALECAKRGQNIIVLEYENESFTRASYINQARIHNGYHYPRSYATAIKSAQYFERFVSDFGFCIQKQFKKIYATANSFSWTNGEQLRRFCAAVNIKCDEIDQDLYFEKGKCDGVFETHEYVFDHQLLKMYFLNELAKFNQCEVIYNVRTQNIQNLANQYIVTLSSGSILKTEFILNATYGSINQILNLAKFEPFQIKYELCEMILCKVSENIKNVGITLMDGPFFSLIPFGNGEMHTLSAVQYTPHKTSYDVLPTFDCQKGIECSPLQLQNCNFCPNRPKTNWLYMHNLTKKYLKSDIEIEYVNSIFAIKAILNDSEVDDSRPTVIRKFSEAPYFYSVLSGKINTIFDLDELL